MYDQVEQASEATMSLMGSGGRSLKRNTLTENLDQEIAALEDRLVGLKSLKSKLDEVPGVQEILDLLTQHGMR